MAQPRGGHKQASRSGESQLPPDDPRDEPAAGTRAVDEREDAVSDVVTAVHLRGGLDRGAVGRPSQAGARGGNGQNGTAGEYRLQIVKSFDSILAKLKAQTNEQLHSGLQTR